MPEQGGPHGPIENAPGTTPPEALPLAPHASSPESADTADDSAFELYAETDVNPDDPYELVEDFLAENTALFATSNTRWREVREERRRLVENLSTIGVIIKKPVHRRHSTTANHRALQRSADAQARKGLQQDISIARTNAYFRSRRWTKDADDWSDDAIHTFAESQDTPEDEARISEMAGLSFTEAIARHYIKQSLLRTQNLRQLYTLAYIYQEKAARKVLEAFENDVLVLPLTERILGLAEDGKGGMHEFPGLLEALALQFHTDNGATLSAAVTRVGSDSFRTQFVHQVLASESERRISLSPEVAGLVAGIQLVAAALERSSGTPIENVSELLLQYPDIWPEMLTGELRAYTEVQLVNHQQEVQKTVQPYLQKGRLPSTSMPQISLSTGQMSNQKPTLATVKLAAEQRRQAAHRSKQPPTAEGEDLGGEIQAAVSRIGYMKKTGGSGSRVFEPVLVNSLDELIKAAGIKNYIKKYRDEPGLEATLRACLTSLMEQPLRGQATRQLVDSGFSLWVEHDEKTFRLSRKLRRLSLQKLPDISTGPISSKTRVYYDVPMVGGEYWLLINGVFHKNTLQA